MPIISAITTCKGRLEHLKISLPSLVALADCEVVVVDYDCPDHAGDWVRATYPQVRVVQVGDRPYFSVSKARNLGAAASKAPWLFMVDADVIVSPDLIDAASGALASGVYLLPTPRPPELHGALLIAREDFEAIGGYDEAFEGWGSEDVDLIERLNYAGRTSGTFPGSLLVSVPHDDALRSRFQEIADLGVNWTINALYRAAKMDLVRQGVRLDPQQARNLYAGARAAVRAPGGPLRLQVSLPRRTIVGLGLDATLTYQLSATETPRDQA